MKTLDVLNRPDLTLAAQMFANACRVSRDHSALALAALKRYGSHGPDISGCVREHFPERIKAELRLLAMTVTTYSDAAWKNRPRRVRAGTMRKLARAVAARDGSGFYGPQP